MLKPIDLSLRICKGMTKYLSDPEPEIKITPSTIEEETVEAYSEGDTQPLVGSVLTKYKSGYSEFSRFRNHHGTHIDAPSHKIPGGKTITDYPPGKFINKGILIDLTNKGILARKDRRINLDDIKDFNFKQDVSALVFYTGFCFEIIVRNHPQARELEKGFPYFTLEAAQHIAENSQLLNIIGIDSYSFDRKGSNSEVHRTFLEKDILLLETLVNLAELKEYARGSFELVCMPLPYLGLDAAQTRAYAEV